MSSRRSYSLNTRPVPIFLGGSPPSPMIPKRRAKSNRSSLPSSAIASPHNQISSLLKTRREQRRTSADGYPEAFRTEPVSDGYQLSREIKNGFEFLRISPHLFHGPKIAERTGIGRVPFAPRFNHLSKKANRRDSCVVLKSPGRVGLQIRNSAVSNLCQLGFIKIDESEGISRRSVYPSGGYALAPTARAARCS